MTIKQKSIKEKYIITPETKIISSRDLLEDKLNGNYDEVIVAGERYSDITEYYYGESIFSERGGKFIKNGTYGARLESADLRGRNLRGIIIPYAHLWKANLIDADLENAVLYKSSLTEADLENANLQRANLRHVNLRSVDLAGANFKEADLSHAFTHSYVTGDTNFERTNFRSARIRYDIYNNGPNFKGANFEDAQLKIKCIWIDSFEEGANFLGANFKNTWISNSDFDKANLRGTNLHQAGELGVNLSKTRGIGEKFIQVNFGDLRKDYVTYFLDQDILFWGRKRSLREFENLIKKQKEAKLRDSKDWEKEIDSIKEDYKPYEDAVEQFKEAKKY